MSKNDELNKAPDFYKDIFPNKVIGKIEDRIEELKKDSEDVNKRLEALVKNTNHNIIDSALNSLKSFQ